MERHCDQQECEIKELRHKNECLEEELESTKKHFRRVETRDRKTGLWQMNGNGFGGGNDAAKNEQEERKQVSTKR